MARLTFHGLWCPPGHELLLANPAGLCNSRENELNFVVVYDEMRQEIIPFLSAGDLSVSPLSIPRRVHVLGLVGSALLISGLFLPWIITNVSEPFPQNVTTSFWPLIMSVVTSLSLTGLQQQQSASISSCCSLS
jgi:hypothetical protein